MTNWTTAVSLLLLVWIIGGTFGVFWITNSLSKNLVDVRTRGLDGSNIKSVIRKAVYVYLFVLMLSVIPWSVVLSTIGAMADQYFRNTVNRIMSDPDLFNSISITPDEYASLPRHWRQALAEIVLRPEEKAAEVKRLVKGLTLEDIKATNLILPYWTSAGIIRDQTNKSTAHPMPELHYTTLIHLANLGILDNVARGAKRKITGKKKFNGRDIISGTTVHLEVTLGEGKDEVALGVTAFTKGGRELVEAMRVPSNVPYFEWIAKKLEEASANVELLSTSGDNSDVRSNSWSIWTPQGRILRKSIPEWPPNQ